MAQWSPLHSARLLGFRGGSSATAAQPQTGLHSTLLQLTHSTAQAAPAEKKEKLSQISPSAPSRRPTPPNCTTQREIFFPKYFQTPHIGSSAPAHTIALLLIRA